MTDSAITSFVAEQRQLLALELQADEELDSGNETEERATHILGNLEASDVSVGLYGRTVVQLTMWEEKVGTSANINNNILPAHRITVGDEVEIRTKAKPRRGCAAGVVCEVSDTHVAVALFLKGNAMSQAGTSKKNDTDDDEDWLGSAPLTLVPQSSAEVHRKMLHALSVLEKQGANHPVAGGVIQAMFIPQLWPPPPPCTSNFTWEPLNPLLDASQKEAITFGLQPDRPIALIHGPPGTGKTTTVTELIQQAVHVHKLKVLVTAPSNVAVDNILERLIAWPSSRIATHKKNRKSGTEKVRAVRLGHPARLKSSILPYSLEALVQSADGTEIVADVRQELQSYLRILSNPKSRGSDKRIAYQELKSLRREIRTREEKIVQELITSAQVVLATTVGASNRILDHVDAFDLVVIDEAAQALEASCWIPILRGKRVVLAGDHCQLPPTIKSNHGRAQQGLSRTMFERLMQLYEDDKLSNGRLPKISRMLTVQYRMHEQIANWASTVMYHGQLQTHETVKRRTLSQLEGFQRIEDERDIVSETPLLLIDTAGCDMHEMVNSAGSRYNPGEAALVAMHVKKLMGAGMKPGQICVITPYNGQVECLRSILLPNFPTLEIRSVDGFQGGEREAVILSLVRSSDRGGRDGIGFLKDDRRQNVAVTRAKRHLAVICDSATVTQSKFIATLIAWIEEHGEQCSAVQYQSSDNPVEADLRAADEQLLKLVQNSTSPTTSSGSLKIKSKGKLAEPSDMNPEARQGLMDKIATFAEKSTTGDEMVLSSTLTSYDRRLVHEFSAQIGLGHRSEGTQGLDRRIILLKGDKIADPLISLASGTEECSRSQEEIPATDEKKASTPSTPVLSFSLLAIDDSDESDDKDPFMGTENTTSEDKRVANSLLAVLAKERAERQRGLEAASASITTAKKIVKKKTRGQKLGRPRQADPVQDKKFDNLDDMAFLDAQIERVHNSHGRQIVASGKEYRTIVNGILNARTEPRVAPKNTQAAASLQSKLKESQNGRKAKITKKK